MTKLPYFYSLARSAWTDQTWTHYREFWKGHEGLSDHQRRNSSANYEVQADYDEERRSGWSIPEHTP